MKQANPCNADGRGRVASPDGRRQRRSSGNVPNAYWNRDNEQANVDRDDPGNRNSDNGARAAVED